jgi:hypothetical protein
MITFVRQNNTLYEIDSDNNIIISHYNSNVRELFRIYLDRQLYYRSKNIPYRGSFF